MHCRFICKSEENSQTSRTETRCLFQSALENDSPPRRVEQIVAQCLAQAGLGGKGYSPHKLRHTAATLMYRSGQADMLALQEILGHANVSTTQIYTHISRSQLDQAVNASPLANIHKKNSGGQIFTIIEKQYRFPPVLEKPILLLCKANFLYIIKMGPKIIERTPSSRAAARPTDENNTNSCTKDPESMRNAPFFRWTA